MNAGRDAITLGRLRISRQAALAALAAAHFVGLSIWWLLYDRLDRDHQAHGPGRSWRRGARGGGVPQPGRRHGGRVPNAAISLPAESPSPDDVTQPGG